MAVRDPEQMIRTARVVEAGGGGDTAVVFSPVFADTDYTVTVSFEDTAGGAALATAYVKNGTKAAGGLTLTTSANGTFHVIAIHD